MRSLGGERMNSLIIEFTRQLRSPAVSDYCSLITTESWGRLSAVAELPNCVHNIVCFDGADDIAPFRMDDDTPFLLAVAEFTRRSAPW